MTLEFTPAHATRRPLHRDILGGGPFGFRPGEGSDDSDLTWAVTEAIIVAGDRPGRAVRLAADNMLAWLDGQPSDVGSTTRSALGAYRRSGNLWAAAGEWSAGNGSLMRALPSGLARQHPQRRTAEAVALSAITHSDPRCTGACVAYCDLAHALLAGADPQRAVAEVAGDPKHRPDVRRALRFGASAAPGRLSPSGYVLDTLSVAAWSLCQPGDFEDVLVSVVNLGGDADTTGAVAGGLLGVRHGRSAIPTRWLDPLDYTARFDQAARAIEQLLQ